jgi:hypothetical protein
MSTTRQLQEESFHEANGRGTSMNAQMQEESYYAYVLRMDATAPQMEDKQFLSWLRAWMPHNAYARVERAFDLLVETERQNLDFADTVDKLEEEKARLAEELGDVREELADLEWRASGK